MIDKEKKSAADYTPIFGFVISYFLFHLFDWQEATHFVFSVIVSLIIFMIELRFLKEEYALNRKSLKNSNFFTGLLSILAIVIFIFGILSWYKVVPYAWRMALLLGSIVIYIAVLFRAINTIILIKNISEKRKSTR